MGDRPRGRPRLAPLVAQLPSITVPVPLRDAVAAEALRRDVPRAQVVREAVISHLKNGHGTPPRV